MMAQFGESVDPNVVFLFLITATLLLTLMAAFGTGEGQLRLLEHCLFLDMNKPEMSRDAPPAPFERIAAN
jgi:hypothetical protein